MRKVLKIGTKVIKIYVYLDILLWAFIGTGWLLEEWYKEENISLSPTELDDVLIDRSFENWKSWLKSKKKEK